MYRFFLAIRWLASRPINLLGVLGITLGVWALIVVVSIFSGYLVEVRKHVAGSSSDLSAIRLPPDVPYARLLRVIEADPEVAAAAPRLIWFGLLHSRGEAPRPAAPPTESASGVPGADGPFVVVIGIGALAQFLDQLGGEQALDHRIESAGTEADAPARPLGDVLEDGVAVPIAIGERDEDIERVPRQRQEVVGLGAFTADARHGPQSTRLRYSDQWNS